MKEMKTIYQHLIDELKCSFCLATLVVPMVTDCSHLFCSKCITDYLKKRNLCPVCKAFIQRETTLPAPRQINNILTKLSLVKDDLNHPFNRIKRTIQSVETVDLQEELKENQKRTKHSTNRPSATQQTNHSSQSTRRPQTNRSSQSTSRPQTNRTSISPQRNRSSQSTNRPQTNRPSTFDADLDAVFDSVLYGSNGTRSGNKFIFIRSNYNLYNFLIQV